MLKKISRNPFFIFLPFLCYYIYVVKVSKWPSLYGDEIRYMYFAKNLLHGFYSPPAPHINLWSGPGYPIILMPFVALNVPDLYITMMNTVYTYLAVILLYKALRLIANNRIALVLSILFAMYPNALSMLPILYTEAFTNLLVSGFIYAIALYYKKGKNKYAVIAGLVLGYLILTKIIFGYVVIICLGICLVALLLKKNKIQYFSPVKILLIAFAVAIPYLCYTYHITGKFFYWGNSGGMSLYWMSTPYDNEYGDWKLPYLTNKQYPIMFKAPEVAAILKKNHNTEITYILKHNEMEQDALFKQAAIQNIKNNPRKFLANCVNNFSRMLFNFPYSYSFQDAGVLRSIIIGSSILWATIIGMAITLINWRKVSFAVKFILLITGVYLLLSDILSAYPRQLDIMIPVFLFWMGFLIVNSKKPSLKFTGEEGLDEIELTGLAEMGVHTER